MTVRTAFGLALDPVVPRLVSPMEEARALAALVDLPVGARREALVNFLFFGVPPGAFLHAVAVNDLDTAWDVGDDEDHQLLGAYVTYMRDGAPRAAWGSLERVRNWIHKGLALRAWTLAGSSTRSREVPR